MNVVATILFPIGAVAIAIAFAAHVGHAVLLANGLSWAHGKTVGSSLDHAMWFHRPFRADEWLLYTQESPVAAGARGLARGELFTRDGELVVSVVQEGLIRTAS